MELIYRFTGTVNVEKLSYPIPGRRFFLIRSNGIDEFSFELKLTSAEEITLALALVLKFVLEVVFE